MKFDLTNINKGNFNDIALNLFHEQRKNNEVYQKYLNYLGSDFSWVSQIEDIPFLPIQFFKSHKIKSGNYKAEKIFKSSGTAGIRSQHFIKNLKEYHINCLNAFEQFFGDVQSYQFIFLLPSYLENGDSGLVEMAEYLGKQSSNDYRFFLSDFSLLNDYLSKIDAKKTVFLLGVTYALLNFSDYNTNNLSNSIIMETGGMKGRKTEMTREEVHHILRLKFKVDNIYSEYGMTELQSQAYSKKEGVFYPSQTMKVLPQPINDPFGNAPYNSSSLLKIIDLANYSTCSFIATEDLGKVYDDGGFEVLGRMDHSDTRGCNLLFIE